MKTFLTDLAAKTGDQGHPSGFGRWLLVRQDALRYAVAFLAVAVAFLTRIALAPILQDDSPYLFFVPAVLVAAGVGGLGPGLVATALGALLGFFVINPFPDVSTAEIFNTAAFTLFGAGIAWGGEQLQRIAFVPLQASVMRSPARPTSSRSSTPFPRR